MPRGGAGRDLVQGMNGGVIHEAGIPEGPIQRCSRCGHILTDYRNTATVGDTFEPHWWKGAVIVEGNQTVSFEYASVKQIISAILCNSRSIQ